MRTVTWPQANARRLARQFAGVRTPDAAVRVMLAAQAQVASAADLSIALRLGGGTCADVRAGLGDRSLVRAAGLRGTIHVVAAADLGLWTGTFATLPPGRTSADPALQPTPAEVDRLCAAIGDTAAQAPEPLTLEELHDGVVARAGAWAGELVMPAFQSMWPRWRMVQAEASRRGLLCFGPNRGRAVTYTAPPPTEPIEPRAAAERLLLRYLSAYGPSTPAAYAKWHAAPIGWATQIFDALTLQGRAVEVDLDGTRAWVVHDDQDFTADPPTGIRLLPYFDALAIAAFPRERFFPGRASERALAGGQAGNYPVVLVDGEVAGVWHQRKAGRRVVITVEPLVRVTRRRQAELEEAVERVASLQDLRPELMVGEVTTGPHA